MKTHARFPRACRGALAAVLYAAAACTPAVPAAGTHAPMHSAQEVHAEHANVTTRPAHIHPRVRPTATAGRVLAADRVAALGDAEVARIYSLAREVPQVLDGLYCYCNCDRHAGHHSLLSCFESDHGSHCGVCLREAEMAHKLHQEGKSLQEIRAEIDRAFGGGAGH